MSVHSNTQSMGKRGKQAWGTKNLENAEVIDRPSATVTRLLGFSSATGPFHSNNPWW